MTEMEKALELAIEDTLKAAEPVPFVNKRPQTLSEQIQQLTRIERQLSDRMRHEGIEARITAERKIGDAMAHHARTLAEETARIDRERDELIRQATDEYHQTINDLAGLARRRP